MSLERYTVRRKVLELLENPRTLAVISEETIATDSRLNWHLCQMREAGLVEQCDDSMWRRTSAGTQALNAGHIPPADRAFPQRIIDDFEDAITEVEDGLYGLSVALASGEHRGRLSGKQASEFSEKLVRLVEEYFAPGQGDRTGLKHGFHWVLTPIDLHPLGEDASDTE